jgi:putative ABC transport system substrate-binding protein
LDRIPNLVAELAQLKVDVLVSPYTPAIHAAKQATRTIPIVILTTEDPAALGIVDSLAHPGGNITGITRLTRQLGGKRLELLKEAIPGISRVAILYTEASPSGWLEDYGASARALKIMLKPVAVLTPNPDLEGTFLAAAKERVGALIVPRSPLFINYRKQIADLVLKNQLPSMCEGSDFVEAGNLISYSSNETESFKRAAYYVDKILKGAKPGDLPIEQPTRFELVINMKTAKAIGIKIPQSVLQRADKLIE